MEYDIRQLNIADLDRVRAFYDGEIEMLENKKHFYPYSEKDLHDILREGGGYFLGVFAPCEKDLQDRTCLSSKKAEHVSECLSSEKAEQERQNNAFPPSRLIALAAIDFDLEYGQIIKKGQNLDSNLNCYELSGVVVNREFRGQGLSGLLIGNLMQYAESKLAPCFIMGVVEETNIASQNMFLKNGFSKGTVIECNGGCSSSPHIGFIKRI